MAFVPLVTYNATVPLFEAEVVVCSTLTNKNQISFEETINAISDSEIFEMDISP